MHGARVTVLVLITITSSLLVWADEQSDLVTLTQCIDAALKDGPDVKLSAAGLAQAQAQYRSDPRHQRVTHLRLR